MSKKKCKIRGCQTPQGAVKRGLCGTHYSRYRRGRSLYGPIRVIDGKRGCAIAGCEKKHQALGYCGTHYSRYRRGQVLDEPILDGKLGCVVAGCKKKYYCLGYCRTHAPQARRWEKKLQLVIEFRERCTDCHKKYPPYVLEFDNLGDPEEHVYLGKLLGANASWERIAEEVSKCDMVCSNCHRIRTQERRNA